MDAAWLTLAITAATAGTIEGDLLDSRPASAGSAQSRPSVARPSIDADLLPRKHNEARRSTFAARRVVYQPISGAGLESGFTQAAGQIDAAGQGLNQLGQTLQDNTADARRALAGAQQRYAQATLPQLGSSPQRTLGGELREGAGRLFNRAKSAIGKTGEAIGGTARNLRDALPGRRNRAAAAPPAAGGGFQPYNYEPSPAATATGLPGTPGAAAAGLPTAPAAGLPFSPGGGAPPSLPPATGVPATVTPRLPPAGPSVDPSALTQSEPPLIPVRPPAIDPSWTSTPPPSNRPAPDYGQPFARPERDTPRYGPEPGLATRGNAPADDPRLVGERRDSVAGFGPAGGSSAVISVMDDYRTDQPEPPPATTPGYPAWSQPAPAAGDPYRPSRDPYDQTVARPADPYAQPEPAAGPGAEQFPPYLAGTRETAPPPGGYPGNGYPTEPPPNPGYRNDGRPLAPPYDSTRTHEYWQASGQLPTAAGGQAGLPPGGGDDPREPWKELVLATVVALGSVGGNLFLGWSYLDARNKYRSALRRGPRAFGSASGLAGD